MGAPAGRGLPDGLRSIQKARSKAGVAQENDGSAVGFWRTKCSKGQASHQGLLCPFSHFLHPKSWGRTAKHRKRPDFDGSARKSLAGTLGGCQGALTLQSRKSGPFPALFSYVTPAKDRAFLIPLRHSSFSPRNFVLQTFAGAPEASSAKELVDFSLFPAHYSLFTKRQSRFLEGNSEE